jgi:hypothetical protein
MELSLPIWAQQIALFGVMISSVILGIWKYFNTETEKVKHKDTDTVEVIGTSASFVDNKTLKELIDVLREHQDEIGRQTQRVTRSESELREALLELIETVHTNTNSLTNLLRFIKKPLVGE